MSPSGTAGNVGGKVELPVPLSSTKAKGLIELIELIELIALTPPSIDRIDPPLSSTKAKGFSTNACTAVVLWLFLSEFQIQCYIIEQSQSNIDQHPSKEEKQKKEQLPVGLKQHFCQPLFQKHNVDPRLHDVGQGFVHRSPLQCHVHVVQ